MIGELTALGAALCWTFSAMLYKKALTETKPISANVVRCAGTSLVLVLLFALLRRIHTFASLPAHVILLASISGLIGLGLGDTLYMNSLDWAYLFAGETITLPLVVGAAAIVFGIWLLTDNEKQNKKDGNRRQMKIRSKGLVFALATAMAWSVSISMINLAV
ncbi:DMT family transporter, partial [Candidatus Bathyarchaeota archaeon]|nr:DMT family transporter [Candidatus Bathyarchaeota archaeon]